MPDQPAPTIRPATSADLPTVHRIWWETDGPDRPLQPGAEVPPTYGQELATGTMLIAEEDGRPVAFSSSIVRGDICFLTELFVLPSVQSKGVGQTLLRQVLPPGKAVYCTLASRDYRALALYTRAGMRPRWPNLWVVLQTSALGTLPTEGVTTVETRADDSDLIAMDAEVSGRRRPEDLAYWVERDAGVPLWLVRGGERLGYAVVQTRSPGSPWNPAALTIGPSGARSVADARACLAAALAWARLRGEVVRVPTPGPHVALPLLLDLGGQIVYVETFCSSADEPFFDPRRYTPSTSLL